MEEIIVKNLKIQQDLLNLKSDFQKSWQKYLGRRGANWEEEAQSRKGIMTQEKDEWRVDGW